MKNCPFGNPDETKWNEGHPRRGSEEAIRKDLGEGHLHVGSKERSSKHSGMEECPFALK